MPATDYRPVKIRKMLEDIEREPASAQELGERNAVPTASLRRAMARLARLGLTMPVGGGKWGLATRGLAEACRIAQQAGVDLEQDVELFGNNPAH